MKKLLILILLILFSLSIPKVFAQSTPSAQITNVQYDLPYTGLLPDNPLYFLKALRDNILGLLITEPLKKADYDLLMANKRLGGAQALLLKHKDDLAITTLSKSGNYFFQAIQQTRLAKKQGADVNDLSSRLITASLKHQQIIFQMIGEASVSSKGTLEASLHRAEGFQISAESIKSN